MKSEDVGALPIVEGDKLGGVVTDRDLAVRVLAEGKSPDTAVSEIASKDVVTVDPDQSSRGGRQADGGAPGTAATRRRGGRQARRRARAGRRRSVRSGPADGRDRPADLAVGDFGAARHALSVAGGVVVGSGLTRSEGSPRCPSWTRSKDSSPAVRPTRSMTIRPRPLRPRPQSRAGSGRAHGASRPDGDAGPVTPTR